MSLSGGLRTSDINSYTGYNPPRRMATSGQRKRDHLHESLIPVSYTHKKDTRLSNPYSSSWDPTPLLTLCCSLCRRTVSKAQAVQTASNARVTHLISPWAIALPYEMYLQKVSDLIIHPTPNIYANQIYFLVVNPPRRFAYNLLIFSWFKMWETAHVLENAKNNAICLGSI